LPFITRRTTIVDIRRQGGRVDRRTLLTATAGLLTAIGRPRAASQPSGRSQKDTVMNAERAFAEAMARRDLAAFGSHVATDAIFFSSPDGSRVLRGKNAIVEGWKPLFDGPKAPFSWSPDTAEVLESGMLAMTTGPVRDESGKITGRFSSVWRLEPDGRWRVIFDRGCPCG
jgi:ketosteroid isomerase-like protein